MALFNIIACINQRSTRLFNKRRSLLCSNQIKKPITLILIRHAESHIATQKNSAYSHNVNVLLFRKLVFNCTVVLMFQIMKSDTLAACSLAIFKRGKSQRYFFVSLLQVINVTVGIL